MIDEQKDYVKKATLIVSIFISITCCLFITYQAIMIMMIKKPLVPVFTENLTANRDDVLFLCTNLNVTHIKNEQGTLHFSSPQGWVTNDRTFFATKITATLEQANKLKTTVSAQQATFSPKENSIDLAGAVHARQDGLLIQADKIAINLHDQRVHAQGSAFIKTLQAEISSDTVVIDYQQETLQLTGNVSSEFVKKSTL